MIPTPYIGVFAYLIFQERGIADRNVQQAQQTQDELRRAISLSIADEIEKLDWLKKSRSITAGGICTAARDGPGGFESARFLRGWGWAIVLAS